MAATRGKGGTRRPPKAESESQARAKELQADYRRLGRLLAKETDGSKAAALARERRIMREKLDVEAQPEEVSVADELAARRAAGTQAARPASRRRRSG